MEQTTDRSEVSDAVAISGSQTVWSSKILIASEGVRRLGWRYSKPDTMKSNDSVVPKFGTQKTNIQCDNRATFSKESSDKRSLIGRR